MLISNFTWKEIEKLAIDKKIIVIPVGSSEQHGPHLPISTDSIIAHEITKKVCEDLKLPFTPLIPISCSAEHRDFPGTIYLSYETFKRILEEFCKSLTFHGFKKIVIFNAHGGNISILKKVLPRLEKEITAKIYLINSFDLYKKKNEIQIHADEFETSLILYLKPELVKKEKIKDEYPKIFKKQLKKFEESKVSWRRYTKSGVIGIPTKASREKGRKIFEEMITNFKILLQKICSI
jgi:creatinine amidohydrolase